RLQDWDAFHTFSSRAKHLVSRRIPTVLYYEGIARYLEGQVLYLQKQIEQQLENAQDRGVELLKNLESLVAQNTTGPVFYPRLYHLMAYVFILMGDGQNFDLFLNKALRLSETQVNMLEKCWLKKRKVWSPTCRLQGAALRKPHRTASQSGSPQHGRPLSWSTRAAETTLQPAWLKTIGIYCSWSGSCRSKIKVPDLVTARPVLHQWCPWLHPHMVAVQGGSLAPSCPV
ncbi:hypothetical protein H1C71_042037, partial [Ictidomys tridecemlineatus]